MKWWPEGKVPTEPGWYWRSTASKPALTLVARGGGEMYAETKSGTVNVKAFPIFVRWAGPIPRKEWKNDY